jgi:hypothetical protein
MNCDVTTQLSPTMSTVYNLAFAMPTPHEEHAFKMHAFSLSSPIFSLTG